jgi:hypothetical protein
MLVERKFSSPAVSMSTQNSFQVVFHVHELIGVALARSSNHESQQWANASSIVRIHESLFPQD